TQDADSLVREADIVIEVMGGIEPARELLLAAIASGASVVTANKALLAQDGPTLYAAADEAGVDVYFEAAVAGAIPIIRPVRESLAGDQVERILGIVNGTTNYVMDRMASEGLDLDEVVAGGGAAAVAARRRRAGRGGPARGGGGAGGRRPGRAPRGPRAPAAARAPGAPRRPPAPRPPRARGGGGARPVRGGGWGPALKR